MNFVVRVFVVKAKLIQQVRTCYLGYVINTYNCVCIRTSVTFEVIIKQDRDVLKYSIKTKYWRIQIIRIIVRALDDEALLCFSSIPCARMGTLNYFYNHPPI